MSMQRFIRRSVFGAAAAIITVAPAVFAQGQEIFEWSGRVDREVQVTMRGNQLSTRELGNSENGRYRSRIAMQLPRTEGQVSVQLLSGRGNVDVVQQPSAQNGYTTIVRVRDAGSGSDNYRIAAYWQNYSNGDYIGRNRGRDRNDRGDRNDIYRSRAGQNGQYYPNANGRYGENMLHWSGNVDGELEIRVQNGRVVGYRNLSGSQPTAVRVSGGNAATPRSNAQVNVIQNQGRGTISVVQQPSSYNGYTTVLRVRDPQGGYGYYDFDLNWQ